MKKIFFLVLISYIPIYWYSPMLGQDTLNLNYFKNLKETILKDSDVEKIKFIQKQVSHHRILIQELYVRYKNDSSKRYWRIGKQFVYDTKNGKLVFTSCVDITSKTLVDTTFSYNENGEIIAMLIYNKNSPNIIPFKNIHNILSIFCKYYENTPSQYRRIEFCNGKKTYEETCTYNDEKGFVKDGDVTYYNEDGKIEKVVKYRMGVEIK